MIDFSKKIIEWRLPLFTEGNSAFHLIQYLHESIYYFRRPFGCGLSDLSRFGCGMSSIPDVTEKEVI